MSDTVSKIALRLRAGTERFTFNISVLGVQEDGAECAIALEMSLRGYGDSFEDALSELEGAIWEQVTFCAEKGDPAQVFVPADQQYWHRYAKRTFDQLQEVPTRSIRKPRLRPRQVSCTLPTSVTSARDLAGL